MFISLAAATPLESYAWFKIIGAKKLSFNNHNPKHELTLVRGDVFGIYADGSRYKLIDLSAPRIVFDLSKDEVVVLYGRSVGFSPEYKGRALPAGSTVPEQAVVVPVVVPKPRTRTPKVSQPEPAVVPNAPRVHIKEEDADDSLFPYVSMPPTRAEIARLYTLFNKKYFNNDCPDLKDLKIQSSSALRFLGEASVVFGVNYVPEYKLKIAKTGFTNGKRVITILLHEMIHLMHYKKAYGDRDDSYIRAGHGPLFLAEMHRLNSLGYNIRVKDDGEPENGVLAAPAYVMMFNYNVRGVGIIRINGQEMPTESDWVVFYSTKPFKDNVETISNQFQGAFRTIDCIKYIYGKTTSTHAYRGRLLTRENMIPSALKKMKIFNSADKAMAELLEKTEIIEEKSLEVKASGGVRESVVKVVNTSDKDMDNSWENYLANVLGRAIPSSGFVGSIADRIINQLQNTTPDELAYIKAHWMNVKPYHFMKKKNVKLNNEFLLRQRLDGKEAVSFLMSIYKNKFKDRLDADDAADMLISMYGKILTDTNAQIRLWVREILTS
jgi:hypothetical protein